MATPLAPSPPGEPIALDQYPVTVADYQRFIQATGHRPPPAWPGGRPPTDLARHPVTGITWHEAVAYASWLGRRLPTAAEWEQAARGGDGRRFPWGDTFDRERCNTQERGEAGTTPVDRFPNGVNPAGLMDLAGNVWEWVLDEVRPRGLGKPGVRRALKGGAFNAPASQAECGSLSSAWPDERLNYVGFRCVRPLSGE
jgi:formylglycine-generating enzyme required for sulfatase activity